MRIKNNVTARHAVTPTNTVSHQANLHAFNSITGAQALAILINPAFNFAELQIAYHRRDEGRAGRDDLALIRRWEFFILHLPSSQIITGSPSVQGSHYDTRQHHDPF